MNDPKPEQKMKHPHALVHIEFCPLVVTLLSVYNLLPVTSAAWSAVFPPELDCLPEIGK